tara:strand:+ start:294 stop:395 length:102 start_codon:yes stop_codon:yes gene_type:complete
MLSVLFVVMTIIELLFGFEIVDAVLEVAKDVRG